MRFDKNELRKAIEYWQEWAKNNKYNQRPSYKYMLSKKIATVALGVRRSGKSTVSIQNVKEFSNKFFYLNFEDPFFVENNKVSIIESCLEVFVDIYGEEPELVILDEVQNIEFWEKWVRKSIDTGRYYLIITGSSAKLLSTDLATTITGRSVERPVFPLSFKEYSQFRKFQAGTDYERLNLFKEYMYWGGFPELFSLQEEDFKIKVLRQYLSDILYKDIVYRHEVRNVFGLNQIVTYYLTNISSLHSFTKLKNAYGLNVETVQEYSLYLEEAYLYFFVNRYHFNLKVQVRDPRKGYCVDTGLRNMNTSNTTPDWGKLAENCVFLELKRRGMEVFYYKEEKEVDFIVVDHHKPVDAIQVSYSNLEDESTYKREVSAIMECLNALNLGQGIILTENRLETVRDGGKTINMIPLFRWLSEQLV